jgi:hypothetical protein
MAFTLIGYSETQDTSGNLTNVAALADPHVRVIGDDVIVPDDLNYLASAYQSWPQCHSCVCGVTVYSSSVPF